MPVLQINMLQGRTLEQKRALVDSVTKAVCDSLGSPPEKVRIILNDMPQENYSVGGELYVDYSKK